MAFPNQAEKQMEFQLYKSETVLTAGQSIPVSVTRWEHYLSLFVFLVIQI